MATPELEMVDGEHFHAWALLVAPYTMLTTGRTITQLSYCAAKQPYSNRATATRHAKRMADPEMGKLGYMALKCNGGAACPYLFEPWDDERVRRASNG